MPTGKFFQLRSMMNGLVLDIQAGSTDPGTQVFMWDQKDIDDDDADNQLFYADRTYGTIRTKLNDYCLEIDDDNTLVINPFDAGNENQSWEVYEDRVRNRRKQSRVLDVAQSDDDERARVCSWDWHGEDNQRWEIFTGRCRYFFIKSLMHGKVLDVQGGDTDPGAKVIMYDQEEDNDNQLWYEDKYGVIRSKLTDFVLDATKGSSIRCEEFEPGNDGQLWNFVDRKLINQEDKKILDIKQACEDNGTRLCAWEDEGQINQRFVQEWA